MAQMVDMRIALFRLALAPHFIDAWLTACPPNPKNISCPIAPNRSFACAFLIAKIEEMIGKEGDPIGWPDDPHVVGPLALAAKSSLLRFIPLVMPLDSADTHGFYRLVLEHGDFGIHNMTITEGEHPEVTSLFDWDTAHIVPAILSDPSLVLLVNVTVDSEGNPEYAGEWEDATQEDHAEMQQWASTYVQVLQLPVRSGVFTDVLS